MTAAGTFVESGRISYGKAGGVTFKTVGHGVLGASGVGGLRRAPDGACAANPRWDDRAGAWRTGKTEIALAWRCACPLFCLEHCIAYVVVNSGDGAQAIIVTNNPFLTPDRAKLVQFTASKRLPAPP